MASTGSGLPARAASSSSARRTARSRQNHKQDWPGAAIAREPGIRGQRLKVNEEIARQLLSQIRRPELRAGHHLPSDRQLAGLFGASRGSVREALRVLELSGVIVSRQGGGNFVTDTLPGASTQPLSQFLERQREHLLDVSEARQMFEPRIAFLAAERAMPEDIDALRRALEEQERGLREDDVVAMVNADRQFHQTLAEAARNQTFIMLHNYLSDLVSGDRREAIENSSLRRTQSPIDHRAIYDAVAAGDAVAASAAMLQHLKNVESILLDALHRYQGAIAGLPRVSAEPSQPSGSADGTASPPRSPLHDHPSDRS
jgi:GntR family transcriptional regulator, transcriptional repressor for pyruvate dehydrogenase complex